MKIYFILMVLLLISQPGCAAAVKKTPMQKAENMAYCWTPDGKVAFYRRIDHWIKMEPDPFPGGGGVYDDYEKNDEAFIVVKDPETKKEDVLFKVPYEGSAPYIEHMDWSKERDELLLSSGTIRSIKPDGSNFRVVIRKAKEGEYCGYGRWSPDGKEILYAFLPISLSKEYITKMVAQGLKPGLYIVNADGTSDRFLIDGENGSWSPDGKQVVYQELRKLMIYIINTDGTGERLLLERGANPIWSPDDKWILCGGRLITLDSKVIVNIKVPGSFSRWSPDMKYLLSREGILQEFKSEDEEK